MKRIDKKSKRVSAARPLHPEEKAADRRNDSASEGAGSLGPAPPLYDFDDPARADEVHDSAEPKRGPGRPATSPRCPRCGAAEYACKCEAIPETFNLETIKFLLRGVGQFSAVAVTLSSKGAVGFPEAFKIWGYSETELDALAPPTQELANKYIPEWLRPYQSEIKFAIVFLPILTAKMQMTVALLRAKQEARLSAAKESAAASTGGGEAKAAAAAAGTVQ